MVIIQMAGGLGNQMFQYALYRQLIKMGKTVKMDDEAGFREDAQRNPALTAFGITYERASRKEIIRITDSSMVPTARIRRKLFGRHNHSYFEENKLFQAQIFDWDDIYLEGYWQSEKYFADVAGEIKEAFGLENVKKNPIAGYGLSDSGMHYLAQMERTESVSIHIRRGDYLLPQNQALFGGICTEDYYAQAMKKVKSIYPDCVFYLFTNDKEWGNSWIRECAARGEDSVVSVDLQGERDYEVLTLMSRCKHNILANSSFSWWASYLNENPGKEVIAPDKWLNGWDCRDIYRADMTII